MKDILRLITVLLFSGLTAVSYADHITVTGSVSGEWNVDTVKVAGDILLEEGASLHVHPGVLVEFHGPYSFYIGGYILAPGTENSRIIFDVADTTGFGTDTIPDGGWNGIQFYYTHQAVDSSIFDYCIFRHGKAISPDTLENHGGAVCVRYFDKVRFSNCLFEDNWALLNGGAIYLENASILIAGCEFDGNGCGPAVSPWGYGGAICSDNSDPYIVNNTFTANSSTGVGGGVAIRFREGRVHNNIFTLNYSALGGAIGYLHYYEYPYSQCNNLIYGNTAAFFGGGIACLDAGPTLVNNTITENSSAYGGGFYVKDSIVPSLVNCILWNNLAGVGPEVYLWDAYASADFYYCDVEGGPELFGGSGGGAGYVGTYENNMDINPGFEYPPDHDYHLSLSSPVMNMGSPDTAGLLIPAFDLDGSPRIDLHAQVIDMGCYEVQWVGVNAKNSGKRTRGIEIYPNPFRDETRFGFYTEKSGSASVEIYDLTGRMVNLIVLEAPNQGLVECMWNGRDNYGNDLQPGSYLIMIRQGGKVLATGHAITY